jgi:hypothetical protein
MKECMTVTKFFSNCRKTISIGAFVCVVITQLSADCYVEEVWQLTLISEDSGKIDTATEKAVQWKSHGSIIWRGIEGVYTIDAMEDGTLFAIKKTVNSGVVLQLSQFTLACSATTNVDWPEDGEYGVADNSMAAIVRSVGISENSLTITTVDDKGINYQIH